MAFKSLFTGGACQASGDGFAQSANPLSTFVDAAVIGPNTQLTHHCSFGLEAAFNQPLSAASVQVPIQAHPYLVEQTPIAEQLNSFWDPPAERRNEVMRAPETFSNPWFRSFDTFSRETSITEHQKAQINIKGTAEEIIHQMENSGNLKFKQSKFLRFLHKLTSGAYVINEDNTLTKNRELLEKFKEGEETKEELTDPFDVFDKYWNDFHAELNFEYAVEVMNRELQNDFNLEEEGYDEQYLIEEQSKEERMKYEFEKDNPYKEKENYLELAKKLISEEKIQEAILVLQAEVQQNPVSSEGWCLLGNLHAESDEDERSVACLLVISFIILERTTS